MRLLHVLAVGFQVLAVCYAFHASPLLVASHKLVGGLKSELSPGNILRQNTGEAMNMLRRMITECSSDSYLLVNIPGLTYGDLTEFHKDDWQFLRKYLSMASTLVGVPRLGEALDIDTLERYIINTCEAESINVLQQDESEVYHYIDVRKRVIRVEVSELPEDADERWHAIRQSDDLIRKILRKLPSPHYGIILTSDKTSNVHWVPDGVIESSPQYYEIFNDIINHPSRKHEYERNDRFHQAPPDIIPEKNKFTQFLDRKQREAIHLFDPDLWAKNEKLITTVTIMIVSIFLSKIMQILLHIKKRITGMFAQRRSPVIAHHKVD